MGNLVVTKPNGVKSATILLDPAGAEVLFALTAVPAQGVYSLITEGTLWTSYIESLKWSHPNSLHRKRECKANVWLHTL
jgi:hypothetical protein